MQHTTSTDIVYISAAANPQLCTGGPRTRGSQEEDDALWTPGRSGCVELPPDTQARSSIQAVRYVTTMLGTSDLLNTSFIMYAAVRVLGMLSSGGHAVACQSNVCR